MNAANVATGNHPPAATRLRIVLLYAFLATLWILVSDWGLEWLLKDSPWFLPVATLKGLFYVVITSWWLYLLLRRQSAATGISLPLRTLRTLPMILLALGLLALTLGGMYSVFQAQKTKEVARLQTIADLKTRQIADWLKERRGDAHFVQTSQFFAENYRRWRYDGDAAALNLLKMRLEQFARFRGFASVTLLDAQGTRLWSSRQPPPEIAPILRETAQEIASTGQLKWMGPYRDTQDRLHMEFLAPLAAVGDQAPVVVLDTDPQDWLFQSLATWPVPSASGETLLFRRDGDQILFLNELRHHQGSAAKLRLPPDSPRLLAAQVLRGQAPRGEALEGVDYRGQEVLGVAQPLPESDWYLIAKMDKEELLAEAGRQGIWIAFVGLLALFMAVASLHLWRQRQELALAASVQQSQAERLRALQLLDAVANSSTDAIFAKDLEGRYILFNQAAATIVGRSAVEVLGQDDRAVFPADRAEKLMAQNRRVIEEEVILTHEEIFDTPYGQRVFLASKAPLRNERGAIIGLFGISRDITERKTAEERLRRSEAFKQVILDSVGAHIAVIDAQGDIVTVNRPWLGFAIENGPDPGVPARHTGVGVNYLEICRASLGPSSEGAREAMLGIQAVLEGRRSFYTQEYPCHSPSVERWFSMNVTPLGKGQQGAVIAHIDITSRKLAEQAVRESEARWIMAIDSAGHGVWDWDLSTDKVYYSPRWKTMLGYTEAEIGDDLVDWANLVHPDDLGPCLDELERHFRGETPTYISEYRLRAKEGRYLWILDQGRVVSRDDQGRPLRAIGTHTDVSWRRETEERLRENEQRFRTLFESALVSIIIHDPETGGILDANRRAIESYGFDNLEELQRNDFWLEPPYSFAEALQLIRQAAREGPQRFEWKNRDRRGRLFWEDVLLNRVTIKGVDQVLSITIDITARKAAEEELLRYTEELHNRNAELERFNRASVGRELDMIELKKRINALSRELGHAPPYALAFLDTADQTKQAAFP